MDKTKDDNREERTLSHITTAAILGVTRVTVWRWQREPFTVGQVRRLIADRELELVQIKRRFQEAVHS